MDRILKPLVAVLLFFKGLGILLYKFTIGLAYWTKDLSVAIWLACYKPFELMWRNMQKRKTKKGKTFVFLIFIAPVAVPAMVVASIIWFVIITSSWSGKPLDLNYVNNLNITAQYAIPAGERTSVTEGDSSDVKTCGRSAIVDTAAYIIENFTEENAWVPGSIFYKAGPFGVGFMGDNYGWESTPFFDNKASDQIGMHDAVTLISFELVENLGLNRGTSAANNDLKKARGNLQIDTDRWYLGEKETSFLGYGFVQESWTSYSAARLQLLRYNDALENCEAIFDARADNLLTFLDRIAKNIGNDADVLDNRAESSDAGWFDFRADDHFRQTSGKIRAHYLILQAARHDFRDVIEKRSLESIWVLMEEQFRQAAELDPAIISNGAADGLLMPSHLKSIGSNLLFGRAKLKELTDILAK